MAKRKRGAFLASTIPKLSNEPSIMKTYAGCSAWSFIDGQGKRRFVLLDKEGEYKEGDKNYREYENILIRKL